MNFTKATLSALTIASAFFMSSAQATVVTTTNTATVKVTQGTPDTFTLTLADFIAGKTTYSDATLSVRLTDGSAGEAGTVTAGNQSVVTGEIANGTSGKTAPNGTYFTYALNAASLADLNLDGKIVVTIASTQGDYNFADATLSATSNAVPEPMSLGLLAIGMLGFGAARRRKAGK